jgi:hypothetical protein
MGSNPILHLREVEEPGRPRLPWTQELGGSNPPFPTKPGGSKYRCGPAFDVEMTPTKFVIVIERLQAGSYGK